jgi:hypothetical protein
MYLAHALEDLVSNDSKTLHGTHLFIFISQGTSLALQGKNSDALLIFQRALRIFTEEVLIEASDESENSFSEWAETSGEENSRSNCDRRCYLNDKSQIMRNINASPIRYDGSPIHTSLYKDLDMTPKQMKQGHYFTCNRVKSDGNSDDIDNAFDEQQYSVYSPLSQLTHFLSSENNNTEEFDQQFRNNYNRSQGYKGNHSLQFSNSSDDSELNIAIDDLQNMLQSSDEGSQLDSEQCYPIGKVRLCNFSLPTGWNCNKIIRLVGDVLFARQKILMIDC